MGLYIHKNICLKKDDQWLFSAWGAGQIGDRGSYFLMSKSCEFIYLLKIWNTKFKYFHLALVSSNTYFHLDVWHVKLAEQPTTQFDLTFGRNLNKMPGLTVRMMGFPFISSLRLLALLESSSGSAASIKEDVRTYINITSQEYELIQRECAEGPKGKQTTAPLSLVSLNRDCLGFPYAARFSASLKCYSVPCGITACGVELVWDECCITLQRLYVTGHTQTVLLVWLV